MPDPSLNPGISRQIQNSNHWPLRRRLCLLLCTLLSVLQVLYLHRRLLPLVSSALSSRNALTPTPDVVPPTERNTLFPQSALSPSFNNLPEERTTPSLTLDIDILDNNATSSERTRRLPDALIIGVRKGGTRALLDALALHPRVQVARHEVHFFDHADHFRQGPSWYQSQMPEAGPDEVIIEKTPAYFTNPVVPKRVWQLNPAIKLLLIVREPVARTISDFTQIRQTKRERHKPPLDFQRMSILLPNASSSNWSSTPSPPMVLNTRFKPIRNSLYADHLERWLRYFPAAQLLVLDGDKFIGDPLSQIRLAERFLGIDVGGVRADQLVYSARKRFFCFRRTLSARVHCLGHSKGRRAHVPASAQFKRTLQAQYAPHNRRFFRLLNRVFPAWQS